MNYLHYEVDVGSGEAVKVKLDRQANLLLLDDVNYEKYQKQEEYNYYGGLAKASPVTLKPPSPGKWHLVVDLGGEEGEVGVAVTVVKK